MEDIEELLYFGVEQIDHRDGILCCMFRSQLYRILKKEFSENLFQLIQLRIAVLCVQTTAIWLKDHSPLERNARQLLNTICQFVEQKDLLAICSLQEDAEQLFRQADIIRDNHNNVSELNDIPNQEQLYAAAAIAQLVILARNEIPEREIHSFYKKMTPRSWMPSFWASLACSRGLPQSAHGCRYKMQHFWRWYIEIAVKSALDLTCSLANPQFSLPPALPSKTDLRFARPVPPVRAHKPRTIRYAFFEGYIEKTTNKKGNTISMQFRSHGQSSGMIAVDYRARTGIWNDENYGAEKYKRGTVEHIHLSEFAGTKKKIDIHTWVREKEANLLHHVAIYRTEWLISWAKIHWEHPFHPSQHLDDIRHCLESYNRVLETNQTAIENNCSLLQVGWCLCSFALNQNITRARSIFPHAWHQEYTRLYSHLDYIKRFVGKHFPSNFWPKGYALEPAQEHRS